MSEWYDYYNLNPAPLGGYDWHPGGKGNHPDDNIDFHVDLGAGRLPKGRLKIDRHGDADLIANLDTPWGPQCELDDGKTIGFPFKDESIHSIISHHCLEHIGEGFLPLMDECYRVLRPSGKFRIIVPLFPSLAAVSDPDHVRYFTETTFESFCGDEKQEFWSDVFAEPYTKCRFKLTDKMFSPPEKFKVGDTVDIDKLYREPREIRVTLQKGAP